MHMCTHTYIRIFIKGIGSCDHGGRQVPRSTIKKQETQEVWWCSSSPKTGKLEIRKNCCFSLSWKARKKLIAQVEGSQAGGIPSHSGEGQPFALFRPATDWMRPIHKKGGICFTQSVDSDMKSNMNCSNIFLDLSPRVMEIKTKRNKWDLIKLTSF